VCTSVERSGLAWLRLGIWEIKCKRKGVGKGRCLLYKEEENVVHILLKCNEIQRWREEFLDNKLLYIN